MSIKTSTWFKTKFNHATGKSNATKKFKIEKMPEKNFEIVIIFIDFTKSTSTSKIKYGSKWLPGPSYKEFVNLHSANMKPNPFEVLLSATVKMLWDHMGFERDGNKYIRMYGFGCNVTEDKHVFYMHPNNCKGAFGKTLEELDSSVCQTYRSVRNSMCDNLANLSGPTDYSPSIFTALNTMINERNQEGELKHTFMGMLVDGQTNNEDLTKQAFVRASYFPLFVVLLAIGNNKFDKLKNYDEIGTATYIDQNQRKWENKRDIVQATIANDFVGWVLSNNSIVDTITFQQRYQTLLKQLKADAMNEIPQQNSQITSQIKIYNPDIHSKLKKDIKVYDVIRESFSFSTIPGQESTTSATSTISTISTTSTTSITSTILPMADLQGNSIYSPRSSITPSQREENGRCSICLQNVPLDAVLKPCRHTMCQICANACLQQQNSTCPHCRRRITEIENIFIP